MDDQWQKGKDFVKARSFENAQTIYTPAVHPREPYISHREMFVSPFYSREKELGGYFDNENLKFGVNNISIEERSSIEVSHIKGLDKNGVISEVKIVNDGSGICNPGFDVTPNKYVSTIKTEFGSYKPKEEGFKKLRNMN